MWPWTASTPGHVYILHFDRPIGNLSNPRAQAQHYSGFAEDIEARLAKHAAGKGSKLTAAALAQGIGYRVYFWPAPLAVEKLLKQQANTARYCPACAAIAGRPARALPAVPALIQLELALEEELPAIEQRRMDWLEAQIMRGWRAAQIRPVSAGLDDDLL
jgi:hypothetical protein